MFEMVLSTLQLRLLWWVSPEQLQLHGWFNLDILIMVMLDLWCECLWREQAIWYGHKCKYLPRRGTLSDGDSLMENEWGMGGWMGEWIHRYRASYLNTMFSVGVCTF